MEEIRIEIFGRVQGIRFRHFVKDKADELKLSGYVSNKPDGSVLVIAQGERKILNDFLAIIQKGSLLSKIESLAYNWRKSSKHYDSFEIFVDKPFIADQTSSFTNLGRQLFNLGRQTPKHIAIIPDGNRRWAKQKGYDEIEGHRKAGSYENLKMLLDEARKLGVLYFTIWAFSTENWKRSKREVEELFKLITSILERIEGDLVKDKIRFRHIGRRDRLPKKLLEIIERLEEVTKEFSLFNLQICLDYGGRDEIVRAINKAIKSGTSEVLEEELANYLDSAGIPDPDLIIRTSGEYRMSGFMPFQSTYSEFYFTDVHFPDFGPLQLKEAVESFTKRKRRFGGN
ncbi:MAG: polyprenyl diphosphate synthase [Candidatus Pacearchaeota archaeon]